MYNDTPNNSESASEGKKAESMNLYDEGRKLMNSGDSSGAIDYFLRSACVHPHFKTYELVGECYLRQRDFARAVLFLAAATALNRGVRAPSLLARAWYELGRNDKASHAVAMALERDPNNKEALGIQQMLDPKS